MLNALLNALRKLLRWILMVLSPAKLLRKVFGSRNERVIKGTLPAVESINVLEPEFETLSDAQLLAKTEEFKDRLKGGETLDDLLPEAFAAAREAAKRTIGQRPFDVQMLGGIVLHGGAIAEMVTGEGKTLTEVAPAYLNALVGRGVHVVTVNDYLARRDAAWMRPAFEALGLTVGCIQGQMHSNERIPEYAADITYGTNNEFGFDYLRDNMKTRLEDQCQRDRFFAIIDEVDSILIDEARTPLIISGPSEESTEKYYLADRVVKRWKARDRGIEKADLDDKVNALAKGPEREDVRLQLEDDYYYVYSEKGNHAYLTEAGIIAAQKELGVDNFYDPKHAHQDWPHHLEQAIRANMLFEKETDYVVKDGEVVIVDEFTGRLMEGRRWSDGLHQAIESKEGIKIREEFQTLATVTIQNFFRQYDKLSGMTGTALTEAGEFFKIYKLDVIVVPTNRPLIREAAEDRVFLTTTEKNKAVVEHIQEVNASGRPILVGTTSIEKSEKLSVMLQRRGVQHQVLNAKRHEHEAQIVAHAGQRAAVTIATNMAGRGTDILLGDGVAAIGGLHIIGTERHEARRIDNQLRGRAGRQGDPGSSVFFVSLEDDLMRKFARDWVKNMLAKLGMGEGQEISYPMVTRAIERAQKKTEEHNFDIRKNLLEYDKVNDEQRKAIYERRTAILHGEQLEETTQELIELLVERLVEQHMDSHTPPDDWEIPEITEWVRRRFGTDLSPDDLRASGSADAARVIVLDAIAQALAGAKEHIGEENHHRTLRFLLLRAMDEKWKDHLRELDGLRSGIYLRAHGQMDPKVEYRREATAMFDMMSVSIAESVTDSLLRVEVTEPVDELLGGVWNPTQIGHDEITAFEDTAATAPIGSAPERAEPIRRATPKVGRNDPCPCGSGKKYKKCHGAPGAENA
ncbi:MAG: preprotein translocase subunit SecA [Planctomycetota bacterium]